MGAVTLTVCGRRMWAPDVGPPTFGVPQQDDDSTPEQAPPCKRSNAGAIALEVVFGDGVSAFSDNLAYHGRTFSAASVPRS